MRVSFLVVTPSATIFLGAHTFSSFLERFRVSFSRLVTSRGEMNAVMPHEKRIEDLLKRARAGERSALDGLALEYREDLVAFADSRLGPALRRAIGPEDVATRPSSRRSTRSGGSSGGVKARFASGSTASPST